MRPARPSECSPPSAPSRPRTEATETTCREDKGGSGATGTAAAAAGSATLSGREVSGGAPPPCDEAVVFRCREKQTASCLLRCCEGWGSPSGCCFPRDQTQASRDWGPREGIACWLAWGEGKRRRKRGRAAALGRDRDKSPEGDRAATDIEAGTWSDHESHGSPVDHTCSYNHTPESDLRPLVEPLAAHRGVEPRQRPEGLQDQTWVEGGEAVLEGESPGDIDTSKRERGRRQQGAGGRGAIVSM